MTLSGGIDTYLCIAHLKKGQFGDIMGVLWRYERWTKTAAKENMKESVQRVTKGLPHGTSYLSCATRAVMLSVKRSNQKRKESSNVPYLVPHL